MRTNYSPGQDKNGRRATSTEIMMTPMIDVVFLLLVFFLTTSSFQVVEKLLPSSSSLSQPKATEGGANQAEEVLDDLNDVIIKIERQPTGLRYFLSGQPLRDPEEIVTRVQAIVQIRADIPIIIQPGKQVTIGEAVDAYDRARQAGAMRVFFATQA